MCSYNFIFQGGNIMERMRFYHYQTQSSVHMPSKEWDFWIIWICIQFCINLYRTKRDNYYEEYEDVTLKEMMQKLQKKCSYHINHKNNHYRHSKKIRNTLLCSYHTGYVYVHICIHGVCKFPVTCLHFG